MNRFADRLAAQIPQGHFDGTQGVDDHAATAIHGGAKIDAPPEIADLKGISADQACP